jgi:hypothetical protein
MCMIMLNTMIISSWKMHFYPPLNSTKGWDRQSPTRQ